VLIRGSRKKQGLTESTGAQLFRQRIVRPGDGWVMTDLASIGKTNCSDFPSGKSIVYFDVSSFVIVGPSVTLIRRSHFTCMLPSYPGKRSRIG
jgi:hypothetical protein